MSKIIDYPVVIIGSGIAGLSAAIYAARNGNNPLVIHGNEPGGQLTLTTEVANYPGFPETISGIELIERMKKQAKKFGAEFEHGIVKDIFRDKIFEILLQSGDVIKSNSVIAASGARARTLDIPGSEELMGYGLSTCATCDGAFFRDEEMAVIGGGDAALEEANYLTKFASKVYLIHRRDEFRGNKHLQNEVKQKVKSGEIEILKNTEVIELNGSKEKGIKYIKLVTHPDGHPKNKLNNADTTESILSVNAVFYAIGHIPNTDYLKNTGVKLNDEGYIITRENVTQETKTHVEGIFAAGDVVDYHYQQAATASGMGVKAALDVDSYLN